MRELLYEFKIMLRRLVLHVPMWVLVMVVVSITLLVLSILAMYSADAGEGWPTPFNKEHAEAILNVSLPVGMIVTILMCVYTSPKK